MGSASRSAALGFAIAVCAASLARADEDVGPLDQTVEKLKDFSLEDLANLQVVSVSKRPEPLRWGF